MRRLFGFGTLFFSLFFALSPSYVSFAHHTPLQTTGIASFYWQDQMTANGERFNKHDLTAAHKTLPFGTLVKVTRLKNGKSVVVRINDRGPFIKGRIIDLSVAAASKIGLTRKVGITKVKIEVVGKTARRK